MREYCVGTYKRHY